jgi:hypothetical protein
MWHFFHFHSKHNGTKLWNLFFDHYICLEIRPLCLCCVIWVLGLVISHWEEKSSWGFVEKKSWFLFVFWLKGFWWRCASLKLNSVLGYFFLNSVSKNWVCFCLQMKKGGGRGFLNLSKMHGHEHGEEFVITSITGCTLHMILAGWHNSGGWNGRHWLCTWEDLA